MKEVLDEWEVAKGKGRSKTVATSSKRSKKGPIQALSGNGASAEVLPLALSNGVCESDGEEGGKMNGHHNGAPSRSVSTSPVVGVPKTVATQGATDTQQKSSTLQASPLPQRARRRRGRQPMGGTGIQPSSSGAERVNGPSRTSSSKQQDAPSNRPAEPTPTVTQPVQTQKEASLQKESMKKQEAPPPSKPVDSFAVGSVQVDRGRLDSTASTSSTGGGVGGDSAKRLLKDITRCHVSLARHQTNLHEVSAQRKTDTSLCHLNSVCKTQFSELVQGMREQGGIVVCSRHFYCSVTAAYVVPVVRHIMVFRFSEEAVASSASKLDMPLLCVH